MSETMNAIQKCLDDAMSKAKKAASVRQSDLPAESALRALYEAFGEMAGAVQQLSDRVVELERGSSTT